MSYTLVIKDDATMDMLESYLYYEEKQSGLGEQFLVTVQKRFADLSTHPEYYSFIDQRKILRDVALDQFPYVIVYEIAGKEVIIYAVHATHKRPIPQYRR